MQVQHKIMPTCSPVIALMIAASIRALELSVSRAAEIALTDYNYARTRLLIFELGFRETE
ncbi:MAG: hypothetical protein ACREDR_16765 [Blastocatellia bacterium]